MESFENLGVINKINECLSINGINKPTKVQAGCIPKLLEGKEIVACAETGSGKTATFLIPILQKIYYSPMVSYALILTPTRELAEQIYEQALGMAKVCKLSVAIITGGKDYIKINTELSNEVHIIIATPGRLAHMIRNDECMKELNFKRLRYLIIDEADRMFEDNFGKDLEVIFNACGKKVKKLMFTATLNGPTRELMEKIQENAIKCGRDAVEIWDADDMKSCIGAKSVDTIKEYYILVNKEIIETMIVHVVERHLICKPNDLILIFASEWMKCNLMHKIIKECKIDAGIIHGGMNYDGRKKNLEKFRYKQVRVLVASNLLSRGLDISSIGLVINYGIPDNPNTYVHRVGRTGRAGSYGIALTVGAVDDGNLLHQIMACTGKEIEQYKVENDELKDIKSRFNHIYRIKSNYLDLLRDHENSRRRNMARVLTSSKKRRMDD